MAMNFNRVIHLKNPTEILQNSKLPETKNTIGSTSDPAQTRGEGEQTGGNFKPKLRETRKYRKEALRYTKYSERFNICVIKFLEGKERMREATAEEILADNFLNCSKISNSRSIIQRG